MAFEDFLDNVDEKRRMEGITSKKFHFSFKQKICQVITNTENYENATCYSTQKKELQCQGMIVMYLILKN